MTERLVVIGGDAAGMSAASGVRRARPDIEIVVVEKGGRTSYAACGIPYFVAGDVDDVESLVARSPEEFEAMGIRTMMHTEALGIDLGARCVEVRDLDSGATEHLGFDRLMIGTGARPTVLPWPGVDLPHVSVAHTLPDASRLDELAGQCGDRPVVVIGGGYIGIEMAEAFLARGARVTILDIAPTLLRNLDPEMSERVVAAASRLGIECHFGVHVEAITEKAVVAAEMEVPADVVVLALGVTPNSELAAAAGLATGVRDAISVDDHQRTSAEGIYSAGDCAESLHRVTGKPTWIALGTVANKAGRVAGVNLAGGDAAFAGVLGTAITRLVDTEIARTGLTVAEAVDAGFDPVATTIEARTRAHYFRGVGDIAVHLIHDRASEVLIGGQIVGGAGAGKRIDTVATALWAGLRVDEMVDLDLAYAPPFGPVWDPVNTAARQAAR
jgi:NADPH-dependent 2,4-dienoyl-CoA reductase/sulfur reductase-like enzyme